MNRPSTSKSNHKSRVSNIIFKNQIPHTQINKLLQKTKIFYRLKQWRFCFLQSFKKNDPTSLFQSSQTLLIEQLDFHFCKKPQILKVICHINFPRLKSLMLPGNNIKSWQCLGIIDLTNIQYMDLRQNYTSVGKSLIKANLRKLHRATLPKICMQGTENILRRSQFKQSIVGMFIQFQPQDNIYPFICSLIFKQKNWVDSSKTDYSWINIGKCGIQYRVLRQIKKVLGRRTRLAMDTRWPLCVSHQNYHN